MGLTAEHEEFRKVVRAFVEREVAPKAAYYDEREEFPTDVILACGRQGFLGLPIPESYGGAGADYLSYLVCIEELAHVDPSVATIGSVRLQSQRVAAGAGAQVHEPGPK